MSFRLIITPLRERTEYKPELNELVLDTIQGNISIYNGRELKSKTKEIKNDFNILKLQTELSYDTLKELLDQLGSIEYSTNNINEYTYDEKIDSDILGVFVFLKDKIDELYSDSGTNLTNFQNKLEYLINELYPLSDSYSDSLRNIIKEYIIENEGIRSKETNYTSVRSSVINDFLPKIEIMERKVDELEQLADELDELIDGLNLKTLENEYNYQKYITKSKKFMTYDEDYIKNGTDELQIYSYTDYTDSNTSDDVSDYYNYNNTFYINSDLSTKYSFHNYRKYFIYNPADKNFDGDVIEDNEDSILYSDSSITTNPMNITYGLDRYSYKNVAIDNLFKDTLDIDDSSIYNGGTQIYYINYLYNPISNNYSYKYFCNEIGYTNDKMTYAYGFGPNRNKFFPYDILYNIYNIDNVNNLIYPLLGIEDNKSIKFSNNYSSINSDEAENLVDNVIVDDSSKMERIKYIIDENKSGLTYFTETAGNDITIGEKAILNLPSFYHLGELELTDDSSFSSSGKYYLYLNSGPYYTSSVLYSSYYTTFKVFDPYYLKIYKRIYTPNIKLVISESSKSGFNLDLCSYYTYNLFSYNNYINGVGNDSNGTSYKIKSYQYSKAFRNKTVSILNRFHHILNSSMIVPIELPQQFNKNGNICSNDYPTSSASYRTSTTDSASVWFRSMYRTFDNETLKINDVNDVSSRYNLFLDESPDNGILSYNIGNKYWKNVIKSYLLDTFKYNYSGISNPDYSDNDYMELLDSLTINVDFTINNTDHPLLNDADNISIYLGRGE